MPLIPPIGDAYIDEIIKAIDPFDPSLNKTQGVKLRELIKLMRDRLEQQAAMAVAMQQTYTEVGNLDVSVSPGTYFDQPTTFIVNRNSGSDAVISFQNFSAEGDKGKVYHIKNMGLKPAVLLSSAGAFFDGESSVTLPQYGSVTIMSVTLSGATAGAWAIMSSKGKAGDDVQKILTLNINGLPESVAVAVNGVVWPNRSKAFPEGTVLQNLVVTATGYTITPPSVPSVTMDADKTLNFDAVAIVDPVLTIVVNGLDDAYEVAVDNVVWPDNKKAFPYGTVLTYVTPTIDGWVLNPLSVAEVLMDGNKTLTFAATKVEPGFVLLNGASRAALPGTWTKLSDWVWQRGSAGSDDYSGDLPEDSYMGMQFKTSARCGIYLSENPNASATDNYIGILFTSGVASRDQKVGGIETQSDLSPQPSEGDYVLLRKVGSEVRISYTNDGITFNDVYTLGTSSWSKLIVYGVDTRMMYDPQIKLAPAELFLLPGMSYETLPVELYTESPAHVYTANAEVRIMSDRYMPGVGKLGFKYIDTAYTGEIMLCNANDVNGEYAGFYFDGGNLYWETRSNGSGIAVAAAVGMFAFLTKTATNVLLQTTFDGITFTTVHDFGAIASSYPYIRIYTYNGVKYHYLQSAGVVNEYTLLNGASRDFLPVSWLENPGHIFTRNGTGNDDLDVFTGDGFFGFQFKPTANSGLYLANGPNSSTTDFMGIGISNGQLWREDETSTQHILSPQPSVGQYVVIRRAAGSVDIAYTADGITFTSIYTWGSKAYTNIIAYAFDSSVMYDPQIKDAGDTPLSGAVRVLPSSPWTNIGAYKYDRGSYGIDLLGVNLLANGYIAVRFEADSGALIYLSTTNDTSYSAGWLGIRTAQGQVRREDRDNGDLQLTTPAIGSYIGLRRIDATNIEIFSTTDGITFDQLYLWNTAQFSGSLADHKYLVVEVLSSDYMYDPQGVGLS